MIQYRFKHLAVAAAIATAGFSAAAQEVVLKFHHMWPTVA